MHRYLRAWRKHFRLSLETVAAKIAITHTTLGRWERGIVPLTTENLQSLARVYGITESQIQAPPDEAVMVARLDRLQGVARDMTDEQIENWLHMGELLTRK